MNWVCMCACAYVHDSVCEGGSVKGSDVRRCAYICSVMTVFVPHLYHLI